MTENLATAQLKDILEVWGWLTSQNPSFSRDVRLRTEDGRGADLNTLIFSSSYRYLQQF